MEAGIGPEAAGRKMKGEFDSENCGKKTCQQEGHGYN
jgi:hypothetical protein